MAIKQVRIGSMENVQTYDDAVFSTAIETDGAMGVAIMSVSEAPIAPEDVLRLDDVGSMVGDVYSPTSAVVGSITRFNSTDGTELKDSPIKVGDTLKFGATQVAAGAAAGELWKTVSHATLPDNTIMIGV